MPQILGILRSIRQRATGEGRETKNVERDVCNNVYRERKDGRNAGR